MSQIWSYNAGSPVVTPPAYSPSRNYVVVVSQDLYVHCINNSNGLRVWRVKPTNRTYSNASPLPTNAAQADWGWPVIAEVHGLVLVKYRLDWDTLYTVWSPWPTDNATIRSNLQNRPDQQCMFALDLDDGSNPFICNLGHGGWGDGGYLPMGFQPVVKKFQDGSEIVYAIVRGHTMYDGRWDSHIGEMMLDNTTVSGYQAGYIRYICVIYQTQGNTCDSEFYLTDEQPFLTVAGDYLFASHWECAMSSAKISDRSASRGSWSNKITTIQCPNVVTSQDNTGQCSFSASHYCSNGLTNTRGYYPGFYIYYNQGSVYDSYWSDYACVVVSNNNIYVRSCDSAIVCLESGNPQASIKPASKKELAKCKKEEKQLIAGLNPAAKDRPETGPKIISYLDTRNHIGEIKTVEGELKWVFNNGKAVYLGLNNPHTGYFCVRIMKKYWNNFPVSPEKIYKEGMKVRVRGKIEWYQSDPVMYVTDPSQISIVSDKYIITKK